MFGGSTFASAEEFSHLLEGPAKTKSTGKQDRWDDRASAFDHRSKKRKISGPRGGDGFKGPKGKFGGGAHKKGGFGGSGGGTAKGRPQGKAKGNGKMGGKSKGRR